MLELAILVGLASYRLSRLLATDTIFDRPRHWFFLRFPPAGQDYYLTAYRLLGGPWQIGGAKRKPSWIGTLISCAWCSSVWFAGAIVVGLCWGTSIEHPALVWAASCSVAGICATLVS